jgi:hypothetical protein
MHAAQMAFYLLHRLHRAFHRVAQPSNHQGTHLWINPGDWRVVRHDEMLDADGAEDKMPFGQL